MTRYSPRRGRRRRYAGSRAVMLAGRRRAVFGRSRGGRWVAARPRRALPRWRYSGGTWARSVRRGAPRRGAGTSKIPPVIRPARELLPKRAGPPASLNALRPRGHRVLLPMPTVTGYVKSVAGSNGSPGTAAERGNTLFFGNPQHPAGDASASEQHAMYLTSQKPYLAATGTALNSTQPFMRAQYFADKYQKALCLGVYYQLEILNVQGSGQAAPPAYVSCLAAWGGRTAVAPTQLFNDLSADDFEPPYNDPQMYRKSILLESRGLNAGRVSAKTKLTGRITFKQLTNLEDKDRLTNTGIETAGKYYNEASTNSPTMPVDTGGTLRLPAFVFSLTPTLPTGQQLEVGYRLHVKYDMFFYDRKDFQN